MSSEFVGDDPQRGPGERLTRLAEHREINIAQPIDLAVRAVGGEEQIVHFAELHFTGVLIQPHEELREECGDHVALHVTGIECATSSPSCQRNDRAGDAGQLREVRDDFGRRPLVLSGWRKIAPIVAASCGRAGRGSAAGAASGTGMLSGMSSAVGARVGGVPLKSVGTVVLRRPRGAARSASFSSPRERIGATTLSGSVRTVVSSPSPASFEHRFPSTSGFRPR